MAAVLWTIPLMLLMVAIAVVPILVAAQAEEKADRADRAARRVQLPEVSGPVSAIEERPVRAA